MRTQIKEALERLSGGRVWLEPASDFLAVADLLHALRPRAIKTPLIRIGGDGDGGYLLPDDLAGVTACISPGVSDTVTFDQAMADRGIEVFMADASVKGPPIQNDRFHFVKKFLDVYEDDTHMRLDSLCAMVSPDGDRILQIDIEGAEYRVILDASDEALKSFRIIVAEFHHLTRMFGKFQFDVIRATFEKLLRFYDVVHIHPNNVCGPTVRGSLSIAPVMEFTFYRKDRVEIDETRRLDFPHPLDANNLNNRPTLPLPECWQ
jgi:hypothetical protein